MGISRRALLLGGAGALGAAGVAGALTPRGRRLLGWTGPDGVVPEVAPVSVTPAPWGAWMGGGDGPVVLVLHGRGGSVRWWEQVGLPEFLAASGLRLRLAVLNGADDYWVGLTPPVPFDAALGISMGGFGVLGIATRQPLRAVAAISPAVFPTWQDAERIHGFASREAWEANEPLLRATSIDSPVGIWCGQEDPFHDAAADLARKARAQVGSFEHGAHDVHYWRRVLPEALRFIGDRLGGSALP
ncbi:alpha/beta hydrolase-fold protein [Lentzea chajnantorensis]